MVTVSAGVQTDLSQVTPHVDLFATHLNHKVPLYVSLVPGQNAWVIQKIRQSTCLIIVIAPGWPGMPWFWDLVQLSAEIPPHLPVSRTLLKQSDNYVFHSFTTSQPSRLVSRSGQLQEQSFSVEVAERIAAT